MDELSSDEELKEEEIQRSVRGSALIMNGDGQG